MIHIALFRGINVGGRNLLPMRELVALLQGLGLERVRTYIQSGNAVFVDDRRDVRRLESEIAAAVNESRGFEPDVLVMEAARMQRAIESNPYPEAVAEPKSLHLHLLSAVPVDPDMTALEGLRRESERFRLEGDVFYLHAPEGIGRSKLAANAERLLGVRMTGRNWRTLDRIVRMTHDPGADAE